MQQKKDNKIIYSHATPARPAPAPKQRKMIDKHQPLCSPRPSARLNVPTIRRPILILNSDIVRPSNCVHRCTPIAVITQNTLLALNARKSHIMCAGCLGHLALAVAVVVEGLAALVSVLAAAVGRKFAFSEDEFEDGLEGWDAGGDDDDVGFDAVVSFVRACPSFILSGEPGRSYLVHITRSAVPSGSDVSLDVAVRVTDRVDYRYSPIYRQDP